MQLAIEKDGVLVESVMMWGTVAAPKGGAAHWVPGRSAFELARAWCGPAGPCVPTEILELLGSRAELREVGIVRALPEQKIRFDDLAGEPRNADLAVEAHDGVVPVAINIEGKADETFGQTVREVLDAAVRRIADDERTGAITRVERLAAALLAPWREGLPHLGALRYQLLTGVAGTLAWARELGATRAVFLIHEFVTDLTADANHARNLADLDAFIWRLSDGAVTDVRSGSLSEPFHVAGNADIPSDVTLFIGKAVRDVRGRT